MVNVTIIPARQQNRNQTVRATGEETAGGERRLRVAAYCRVSTDSDEQEMSYTTQMSHYAIFIAAHEEWELAGVFADDGISGTGTKRRDGFNRMIDACLAGHIDVVITKSISRFARNTLDCLTFVRLLRDRGIAVWFEKEGINTLDAKGEVMMTIMASLAQQESQSLSQNVKMGLRYRYQQGKVQVNHNRFLGYTKDTAGRLIIDKKQANVVRRIFSEYLAGASMRMIATGLEADGVPTGSGGRRWWTSAISKILRNEKYVGDALLQKTVTVDFLSKRRIANNGVVPQYYVHDDHEAIVTREEFDAVQAELERRGGRRRTATAEQNAGHTDEVQEWSATTNNTMNKTAGTARTAEVMEVAETAETQAWCAESTGAESASAETTGAENMGTETGSAVASGEADNGMEDKCAKADNKNNTRIGAEIGARVSAGVSVAKGKEYATFETCEVPAQQGQCARTVQSAALQSDYANSETKCI